MNTCSYVHLDAETVASLTSRLLSTGSVEALAETFKVLGDTSRVRILDALSRAELCVCDIARLLGSSESAISHQLRVLRGMRLVRPRRDGRTIFYSLDDQHIVRLFEQGLEHVEERRRLAGRAPAPRPDAAGVRGYRARQDPGHVPAARPAQRAAAAAPAPATSKLRATAARRR